MRCCGDNIIGPTITNNNYVWSYKTNTQSSLSTFSPILFTATPNINGWV